MPVEGPMKPIEIEIIPISGDRVSVSVVYDLKGSAPLIKRWQVERRTLEDVCSDLDSRVAGALAGSAPEGGPRGGIESAGRTFFEVLFRDQCDRLRETAAHGDVHFCFKVDRSLAHLPFEILHDGERFLSQDFAFGRVIYSESGSPGAAASTGDRVFILGDPSDDAAIRDDVEREVDSLRDLFRKSGRYPPTIVMGREVSERMVVSFLPEAALLHFTGHGATGPGGTAGLELYAGKVLTAAAFEGVKHPPAVAFFNTCSTASHHAWRSPLGIMEVLISRGTRACIAPLWDVASGAATALALSFYTYLLRGESMGEALRLARTDLAGTGAAADPTWAAYALYGDPASSLEGRRESRAGRGSRAMAGRIISAALLGLLLILAPTTVDRRSHGVEAPAEVGYVILESDPTDARIFIDGAEAGLTPAAVEVSVGKHQVAIIRKGYRRWQASVDVRKSPETRVRAVLQPIDE
jgi:hypothetical protein